MAKASAGSTEIVIPQVELGTVRVGIVGTSPIICNRMSEKVQGILLTGGQKKTAAEKSQTLKHNPLEEFRSSPYTIASPESPTLLGFLSVSFKKAMMTAALDIPGAKKTQMGRLVRAEGERIPLYGLPQMFMAVTRSADMNRTPDIRTRVIVPKWAVLLDITFAKPMLKEKSVLNLLAAGGMFSGVGDWRTEKGSGNYGSFRLASANDAELKEIIATGGRDAQTEAMNSPSFYDDETEFLYEQFIATATDRGFKVSA